MDMLGKVRRMKLRDKFSSSAIAKLTGLPGNTVKKSPLCQTSSLSDFSSKFPLPIATKSIA